MAALNDIDLDHSTFCNNVQNLDMATMFNKIEYKECAVAIIKLFMAP